MDISLNVTTAVADKVDVFTLDYFGCFDALKTNSCPRETHGERDSWPSFSLAFGGICFCLE